MKACVLKPVIWNPDGYVGPSGLGASSGYPYDHGFGHDEWNNHPGRIWRGYRVFHAEATNSKRLFEYSQDGQLGMLMIASNQGRQWAVGVAAGVFHNDERTEMPLIAAELGLEESWRELWELPLVRRRHENDETKFREFWSGQFHWLQWKTDQALYHWFDRPFALDPMKLKGKQSLVREFGAFQPLEPGAILRLLRGRLPESKAGILRWFQQGPFDQRFHDGYPASDKSGGEGASAAPTSRQVRYWIEGERICEPLHAALQARYVNFLRSEGFEPVENVKGVDVRYRRAARTVFVEVKPTEKVLSRFAIRFAVGQLLEYRHALDEQAELEVVISSQPETPQIEFLRSLGIGLCCQHGNSFTRIL